MTARIPILVPLLFITLLCVGLVEGGYQLFEHFILVPMEKSEVGESETTAQQEGTTPAEGEKKIDYQIILQRKLFGPSPDSEKANVAAAPQVSVSSEATMATGLDIVLMGTITGSEGSERAIIMDKKSFHQDLYEKGGAVQGAFVKEIVRGKVILSYNGRDEVLDMSEAATVRLPENMRAPMNVAGSATAGKSRTPTRVVPRRPVTIAPGAIPKEGQDQVQPGNVTTVRRTLVPQRIYQPAQAPKQP
jgi:type II secretory pathway component PulC